MRSAKIRLDGYYDKYRDARASLSGGEPAIRSGFDVYMEGGALIYAKAPCAEWDARGRFFLSVFPADPRDLPQSARDAGLAHEPLNFDFEHGAGAIFDGKRAIVREMPGYPISRIETGQLIPPARASCGAGAQRSAISGLQGQVCGRRDAGWTPGTPHPSLPP